MKKLYTTLLLLSCCLSSHAQMVGDWIFVQPDWAVNPWEVKHNEDGTMEIWEQNFYDDGSSEGKALYQYDFDAKRKRLLHLTGYNIDGSVRFSHDYDKYAVEWNRITPGSVSEALFNAAQAIHYMDVFHWQVMQLKSKENLRGQYGFRHLFAMSRNEFITEIINSSCRDDKDDSNILAYCYYVLNEIYDYTDSAPDFHGKMCALHRQRVGWDLWYPISLTVLKNKK